MCWSAGAEITCRRMRAIRLQSLRHPERLGRLTQVRSRSTRVRSRSGRRRSLTTTTNASKQFLWRRLVRTDSFRNLDNPAAADYLVFLVEDGSLSWRDGS